MEHRALSDPTRAASASWLTSAGCLPLGIRPQNVLHGPTLSGSTDERLGGVDRSRCAKLCKMWFIINKHTELHRVALGSPRLPRTADTPPAPRAAAAPTSSCCCPASSLFGGPGIYGRVPLSSALRAWGAGRTAAGSADLRARKRPVHAVASPAETRGGRRAKTRLVPRLRRAE